MNLYLTDAHGAVLADFAADSIANALATLGARAAPVGALLLSLETGCPVARREISGWRLVDVPADTSVPSLHGIDIDEPPAGAEAAS